MSREQLTFQQSQQDTAGPEAAPENTHGLPPALYGQVLRLGPADAQALRDLLTLYPVFSRGILAVAAPQVGNAAVQRALAMVQQNAQGQPMTGAGTASNQAFIKDTLADESTTGKAPPVNQAFIKDTLADEPTTGKAPPVNQAFIKDTLADGGTKSSVEPAWATGARTYNDAHADLVAEFNAATNNSCLDATGQVAPEAVASWQRLHGVADDGRIGPRTLAASKTKAKLAVEPEERADTSHATGEEHAAVHEEQPWKPSEDKTETKLTGTYGEFSVKHGFNYDTSTGWEYEVKITMKANDKAKAGKIGWIQVVRRTKGSGGGWATGKDDQGMTEERAKRTDAKTGFRVDRVSAPEKKTPFYGMNKGNDGKLSAGGNTTIGKHGGADAYLYDAPGLYDKDELEFVSTATDLDTGAQYDAVRWGCKYDKDGKVATEVTPTLITAGEDLLAGRDRAINKWNTDVATGDIDKVPTTADPAATAKTLSGMLSGSKVDEAGVANTLKGITDGDLRKRVKASYQLETGKTLADDLRAHLGKDALAGLDEWL